MYARKRANRTENYSQKLINNFTFHFGRFGADFAMASSWPRWKVKFLLFPLLRFMLLYSISRLLRNFCSETTVALASLRKLPVSLFDVRFHHRSVAETFPSFPNNFEFDFPAINSMKSSNATTLENLARKFCNATKTIEYFFAAIRFASALLSTRSMPLIIKRYSLERTHNAAKHRARRRFLLWKFASNLHSL